MVASTWRIYTHTWDEPEHIAAGLELLDRGRYDYDTEHPPLVRVLFALGPWLAGAHSYGTPPPDGTQEGLDILYGSGHYTAWLSLARAATLPFLALLLWTTWCWARRLLASDSEALLAVVLTASVPPLLGHAGLATLDVPAATLILLALLALERWLAAGGVRAALLTGLAAGAAVGTKFSAVPFIACAGLGMALVHVTFAGRVAWRGRALGARALQLLIVALGVLVPLLIAYGPRRGEAGVAHRWAWAMSYLALQPGIEHTIGGVLAGLPLPAFARDLIEGMVAVEAHNDSGHYSFLLGALRKGGWWYFYLVALAVRTPLPLLLAGPAGLALLAREGWVRREAGRLAIPMAFLAILAFASGFSRINIGIRHVLALYPLLAIAGAHAGARAWQWALPAGTAVVRLGVPALLSVLIAWQACGLLRECPDYLPYFNVLVRDPERVLIDSDLDWGQDFGRLRVALHELKVPEVALAYRGTADLARESLPPYRLLAPNEIATGWIAINALAREHNPRGYAWLEAYRPIERIGRTIDLYYVPAAIAR